MLLFMGNMKFRHRVVALVVVVIVLLGIYINLPHDVTQVELQHQHRRMLQSRGYKPLAKVASQEDAQMCTVTGYGPPHHANISTYDLFYHTQFNIKSSGDWEMPVPTKKEVASNKQRLNVVLVPHSHNDPGWLKTVNEYYSDQTKHILNNMVNKLTEYPNMTFIWTETVYFSMWWNELEDAVKVHVRRLIRRGQLEITLGGWVMPDEASTHYVSVIDQLVEGHQWLWENLGVRPENSWSIDPFGYSGTMPYLWQKAGMSNMVIQRVHQAVKTSLIKEKALEFNWRQMWDGKGSTDIFCHIMPFMLYSIKFTCGPNPFTCLYFDFRLIPGDYSESRASAVTNENLKASAEMLYSQYRAKAFYFKYNTILVPIGDDFRYDMEEEWDQQYKNYEKLIQYMNSRSDFNVNIQWGTLKDYFQLTKQEHMNAKLRNKDLEFPVLSGDFFPYSDKDSAYWTGYYSTRPFDKYFSRDVQASIQAADILNTLNYALYKKWKLPIESKFSQHATFLQRARRALGLFLHHDAITGTSKQFVAEDYEQYLLNAYQGASDVMKLAIQSLLSGGKVESPVVFKPETVRKTHKQLPEKQVIPILASGTTVVFFNPLGQPRQQMVHIYVNCQYLEVASVANEIIPSQVSPLWNKEENAEVLENAFELSFLVELEPFGLKPFVLYKKDVLPSTSYTSIITVVNTAKLAVSGNLQFQQNKPEPKRKTPILVDNGVIQLKFDPKLGSLLEVMDLATKNITKLNLSFQYYRSQGSGAYLFAPDGPAKLLLLNIPVIRISKGPLATHVEVGFEPYITSRITLYHHPSHLASAIFIDNELSIHTLKDKEVIMRFNTDIKNSENSYFTDQNGFQFIRRRPNPNLAIEANYYPMTSAVILEDSITRLSLLSAQPHGTSSLQRGELEVMLDRQLIYDDARGMGEGVTDIKTTISRFVLMVERRTSPAKTSKSHFASLSLASLNVHDLLQQPPLAYFTTIETDVFFRSLSPIATSLPCDTAMVSMRSLANGNLNYNGTSVILHRRGYDCDFPTPSLFCIPSDSSLTLDSLFKEFSFSSIHETTLTHTVIKRKVKPTEKLRIAPFEIGSFHLRF